MRRWVKRLFAPLPPFGKLLPPSVWVAWNLAWCLCYAASIAVLYVFFYAPAPAGELRDGVRSRLEAGLEAAAPDLNAAFARHLPPNDVRVEGSDPRPALRRLLGSPLAIEAFYVDEDLGFTLLPRERWRGHEVVLEGNLGSWRRRVRVSAGVEGLPAPERAALDAWAQDQGSERVSWLRNTIVHDDLRESLARMPAAYFTIPAWEGAVRLKPMQHGVLGYFVNDRASDPALAADVRAVLEAHGLSGLQWPFHVGVPSLVSHQHAFGVADAGPADRAVDREGFMVLGALALLLALRLVATADSLRALWEGRAIALAQSNFVAAVSHEMRTPLTTIQLYAEMLEADVVTDPERRRHYLRTIRQEGERLGRLVENVLDYASISGQRKAYRMEPIEARALVEEALAAVAGPLERAGMVAELHAPVPLTLTGDRDALVQSIVNLLGNAVKYGAEGGRVVVSVVPRASSLAIDVADFGPGIPAAEQKKIFKPFYRVGSELTRTTTGSGLGLALVKETAIAHRGRVELESQPGRGSTFRLVLPRQEAEG